MTDQNRDAVCRRRRIADIASKGSPILDLHAADELRGLGNGRVTGHNCSMPGHGGRGRRRADRHPAVGQQGDRCYGRDVFDVDDAAGPAPALAQLRHEVGATGERPRIAQRIAATASSTVPGRS